MKKQIKSILKQIIKILLAITATKNVVENKQKSYKQNLNSLF